MSFCIAGLSPEAFAPLFTLDDAALAQHNAMRVMVTGQPGFPCRVSLTDVPVGEEVLLIHHLSHDVATPYRSAYAIYVSAGARQALHTDALPPVLEGRPIALRAFDEAGMLRGAALALAGEVEAKIIDLFVSEQIAYIHAHNAAHGCFVARVDRT